MAEHQSVHPIDAGLDFYFRMPLNSVLSHGGSIEEDFPRARSITIEQIYPVEWVWPANRCKILAICHGVKERNQLIMGQSTASCNV